MDEDIVFGDNNVQYLYVQPIPLPEQVEIAKKHGWEHLDRTRYRYKEAKTLQLPCEQVMNNGKIFWKKGKVIVYVGAYEDQYKNATTQQLLMCCGSCNPFPLQKDLYMKYNY